MIDMSVFIFNRASLTLETTTQTTKTKSTTSTTTKTAPRITTLEEGTTTTAPRITTLEEGNSTDIISKLLKINKTIVHHTY